MDDGILIYQPKYATYLLAQFHMSDCKLSPMLFKFGVNLTVDCDTSLVDATLYRQLGESLIYFNNKNIDLSFAVNLVSGFMQNPYEIHWGKENSHIYIGDIALWHVLF